jgi:hypothetical protein
LNTFFVAAASSGASQVRKDGQGADSKVLFSPVA